jgi:diguanylate cyclase (GGDEF)-like protein
VGIFLAIALFVAGCVGYIAHWHGERTVREMAQLFQREIGSRIVEHVASFLEVPRQISELNFREFAQGHLRGDDTALLERYFAEQIQVFPSVSSIYLGNPQGGLVNSGREAGSEVRYVIVTDDNRAGTFRKFALDSRGNRAGLLASVQNFDARTREWYRNALETEGAVWNNPYVLFTGQDMAIALSRRVFDEEGSLLGVFSVDVFFSHIAAFLQSLSIGSQGRAFLMDSQGYLLASSMEEDLPFLAAESSSFRRLKVQESRDPYITLAGEFLQGETPEKIPFYGASYKNGEPYLLSLLPLKGVEGLDWLVGIIIPEKDFMANLEEGNRWTLQFVLITLFLAGLFGIVAARKISVPILRLNRAAGVLARGETPEEQLYHRSLILEVRQLTHSFHHMSMRLRRTIWGLQGEVEHRRKVEAVLRQSEEMLRIQAARDYLTGLPNRQAFMEGLEGHLKKVQRGEARGALLMIDLDHFKKVNDQYGHAAGDQVLRDFAVLLLEVLLQEDLDVEDLPGRLGGEEFGVLLPDRGLAGARKCAEKICEKVRQMRVQAPSSDQVISVTVSVGITELLPEDPDADVPLNRADEALYRAKSLGRDRVE